MSIHTRTMAHLQASGISLEEYVYHAALTRAQPIEPQPSAISRGWTSIFNSKPAVIDGISETPVERSRDMAYDEGKISKDPVPTGKGAVPIELSTHASNNSTVSTEEWEQASRAGRTASWGAIFYLTVTDILGPTSAPWAMAQMGYGLGTAMYVIFGVFAALGGYILWRIFLTLDSHRYPLRTFSDAAFRIFGKWASHTVNVMQTVQLFFFVCIITISNGQGLSQITGGRVCFIILCFIWALAGMIGGQIRTLQRLSWLSSIAVWLNIFLIVATMVAVSHTPPNYAAALTSNGMEEGPVIFTAGPPPGTPFYNQIVGLAQAFLSWGGSMMFIEFMSEMRRPMDFWKGMILAQIFILVVYVTFGVVVFKYQGQFAINPAMQGISTYTWQTVTNSVFLVSGLIAACLYGNISIKVLYQTIMIDLLNLPPLSSKKGKWIWVGLVPIYWSIAFLIGSAIPQVSNLSGLVASICVLQFSYTFPPLLQLGLNLQIDGMLPEAGEGFDPVTGVTTRTDRGMKRWLRAYMKKPLLNTFNILFMLASISIAVLGIWASCVGLKLAYATRPKSSFSCSSPVL
ncbi:hypothetical protein D0Z07_2310 [Hyphodiscus hymeniophilus]|uniref:Amino acid transporter transmembrane domain-containing protein n=1 Tax=Hyphodiscus hymeniophilus TaxID=353542 RepID=A0A9P6VN37_9HELO|nr:hypothetical protein D0Z07_2310 [Hyphodiscus hymeniophilus]